MSEIAELEGRITAALARIGAGVDGLTSGDSAADAKQIASLQEALEAEKTANAQLEERVAAIKEKQDTTIKEMGERIETLTASLADQEVEAKRLLTVNAQLRKSNESDQGADSDANQALKAELETLQASRKADLAELETIMGEIKPLIGEDA